jgi:hypothetical protein
MFAKPTWDIKLALIGIVFTSGLLFGFVWRGTIHDSHAVVLPPGSIAAPGLILPPGPVAAPGAILPPQIISPAPPTREDWPGMSDVNRGAKQNCQCPVLVHPTESEAHHVLV